MMINTDEQATALFEAGFRNLVCVIPPGGLLSANSSIRPEHLGKIPGKKGRRGWHGYNFMKEPPPREADVRAWDEHGANIGLMGKHFPALDIDVDDPKTSEIVRDFALKHFGPAPVRLSRDPRRLLVYRTEEPFPKMALSWGDHLVEFLGEGRQYLVHGIHPSGVEYRWDGAPLWEWNPDDLTLITPSQVEEFFVKLQAFLTEKGIKSKLSGRTTQHAEAPPQEDLEATCLEDLVEVVAMIPNPASNGWDEMVRMGYAIKAAGGDEAEYLFLDWCATWEIRHDPDMDQQNWASFHGPYRAGWSWLCEQAGVNTAQDIFTVDPDAVPADAPSVDPRLAALEEVNQTYAVAQIGSDVVILQEQEDGQVVFLKELAFRLKFRNRAVPSGMSAGKTEPLTTAWLGWSHRREYDQTVFEPGVVDLDPRKYNLWRGWAVEASSKGSCERFLDHSPERAVARADHFEGTLTGAPRVHE